MGGEMGAMMQQSPAKAGCCGGASGKELFPTLMALPDLSPAERARVEQLAHQRMTDGASLLSQGLDQLSTATATNDYPAMQAASVHMREGMDQFQSGLAAHRALREDQNPQNVARQWFRAQLSLPADSNSAHSSVSVFHLFTMVALIAFAAIMIWMYFHKMRRADVLISALATGKMEVPSAKPGAPPAAGTPLAKSAAVAAEKPATPPTGAPLDKPATPPASAPEKPPSGPPAALVPSKQNSWTGKLRVMRIFQETPNVKTFRLANPSGDSLPFVYLPGQFITVTVAPKGNRTKRAYTIASSPTQLEYCEATVKYEDHGIVSGFLHHQVHEGDLLEITAPSGKFTFTGKEAGSIVFITGGVGVTPFMSAIRYLTHRCWPGDIFLIYACKSPDKIIFREDLEYIQRRFPNVHVTLVVSDVGGEEWKGKTRRITTELLKEVVPALETRHVHICGPKPFMDAMKGMLAEAGVPAEEIMVEAFAGAEGPAAKPGSAPPAQPDAAATVQPGAKPGEAVEPTTGAPTAPTPAAPNDATPPEPPATGVLVTFTTSGKTAPLPPTKSVLEASEDVGVNIDYVCRVGTCGACKVKLLSGDVTMEVQDALDASDKAAHTILACQAKSTAAVSVEA